LDQLGRNLSVVHLFGFFSRNIALRKVLGDLISIPAETRFMGHLKSLKNVYNNFDEIRDCLKDDLYNAAKLKPHFDELVDRRHIFEALIKVFEVLEKPLVMLQVS
jgi:hypothetical protein